MPLAGAHDRAGTNGRPERNVDGENKYAGSHAPHTRPRASACEQVEEHTRGRAAVIEGGEVWEKGCISVTSIADAKLSAQRASAMTVLAPKRPCGLVSAPDASVCAPGAHKRRRHRRGLKILCVRARRALLRRRRRQSQRTLS